MIGLCCNWVIRIRIYCKYSSREKCGKNKLIDKVSLQNHPVKKWEVVESGRSLTTLQLPSLQFKEYKCNDRFYNFLLQMKESYFNY